MSFVFVLERTTIDRVAARVPDTSPSLAAPGPTSDHAPGGSRTTIAITGATGTFGGGLVPLLVDDPRVGRVVGVSRRPDSGSGLDARAEHRRGDVREPATLTPAFAGADVVVHLAYDVTALEDRDAVHAVNEEGPVHAFRAAVAAGVRRFVYASSLAAYGFSADNPIGLTEDRPVAVDDRFYYARNKARSERALAAEAARHPEVEVHVVRPCGVVGPDVGGAKLPVSDPLLGLGRRVVRAAGRYARAGLPLALPAFPLQLVHRDDVGRALQRCALGDGPAGAYNLAGDGVITLADLAREVGARVVELPVQVAELPSRAVLSLPLPLPLQWVATSAYPAIMDTTRAKEELGWRPRYTGLQAWRDTVGR